MSDIVLTRRGSCEISEDEITVRHSMTAYARNILASWHGVVWALFTVAFLANTLASRVGISGLVAGFAQASVLFFLFLGGMHILRYREEPGTREHNIKSEEVTGIESGIAMNAETWNVMNIYTIGYEKDGEQEKAVVLPQKAYQDDFIHALEHNGYRVE